MYLVVSRRSRGITYQLGSTSEKTTSSSIVLAENPGLVLNEIGLVHIFIFEPMTVARRIEHMAGPGLSQCPLLNSE
jgi:hypothetical protein